MGKKVGGVAGKKVGGVGEVGGVSGVRVLAFGGVGEGPVFGVLNEVKQHA